CYYVSPAGNDANAGSQSAPWRTIGHAVGSVSCGHKVIVENGTYVEQITVNLSCSSGSPVTFQSQNKWGAVIAPSGSGQIISVNGSYVVWKNFELVGNSSGSNNDGIKFQNTATGG